MRVQLDDAGRVVRRLGDDRADRLGGAHHVAHVARLDDAGAERRRHLVAGAEHDQRRRRRGRSPRAASRAIGPSTACGARDRRQPRRVDAERLARLVRPRARARVEQPRRGARWRGRPPARPTPATPPTSPGSRNAAAAAVRRRARARASQAIFGATWPGVEVAAGELAQPLGVDALGRRGALRARAAVAPDQRRVQRRRRRRRRRPAPSSWEPKDERGDLAPGGRRADLATACATSAAVHSRRVLLGPARARVAQRVRRVGRGDQRPVRLERLRAGALRADVDADDERRALSAPPPPGPRRSSVNVNASARWCSRETSTATPSAVRSTWSIVSSSVPRGTSRRRASSPSALRGVRCATPWSTASPRSASAA